MKSHVDKKILGFDMDGVIVDNSDLKVQLTKEMGLNISASDTPSEIIKKIISPADLHNLQIALFHNTQISNRTPLMQGIVELLESITALKIPYYLISRRLQPQIAIDLLDCRGVWKKYFDSSNSYFVITPEDKNATAKALGVTHYVDDETGILSALTDVPNKFLFDNLNVFSKSKKYTKVLSHEELSKYFLY